LALPTTTGCGFDLLVGTSVGGDVITAEYLPSLASLRDAWQWGAIREPWIEIHG